MPGWYFVTMLVSQRHHAFGQIANARMHLSPVGKLARDCLLATGAHHRHASIDTHIFMPNHLHVIYELDDGLPDTATIAVEGFGGPVKGSIPTLVRLYKAEVTRQAHRQHLPWPGWHRGYYERIIRNASELERIRWYVQTNPVRWVAKPRL